MVSMLLLMIGCSKVPSDIPLASDTSLAFDTIITITIYENTSDIALTKKDAELVIDQVTSLCTKYENMLSKTIKSSDIDQINQANGQPVYVNPETYLPIAEEINISGMEKAMETIFSSLNVDVNIDTYKATIKYTSFDEQEKIEVPADVIEKASDL